MNGAVLVVDDHVLFAQAVALALESRGSSPVLVSPRSAAQVVDACGRAAPAVVLLDLRLGTGEDGEHLDGLDLVAEVASTGCRVIVLTGEQGDHVWGTALERGAVAVLPKDVDLDVLAATVDRVQRGDVVTDPGRRHQLIAAARRVRGDRAAQLAAFSQLSPREAQVLRLLAAGQAAGSIARTAHVSEATVRTQIRAVLTKLGVQSQLQAVAVARRAGWLEDTGP